MLHSPLLQRVNGEPDSELEGELKKAKYDVLEAAGALKFTPKWCSR